MNFRINETKTGASEEKKIGYEVVVYENFEEIERLESSSIENVFEVIQQFIRVQKKHQEELRKLSQVFADSEDSENKEETSEA